MNPGDPYDPAALQRNFLNLWQTGLFDDIRIETDNAPNGGVIVRAIVKERPRIGAVEYRGNKELNAAKITEQLEKDKIDLHVGNTIEQTLVRRAAESIKKAYSEGGFEGVTVDTTLEDMSERREEDRLQHQRRHQSHRRAHRLHRQPALLFPPSEKADEGSEGEQHRHLDPQEEPLHPVEAGRGSRARQELLPGLRLHERRVRRAAVDDDRNGEEAARADHHPDQGRDDPSPRRRHRHRHTVFKPEAFIGNFPVKKGDVIRRKPIQDRLDALDELYRMRGYIYSYINPEYVERENNIVDVHITVFEGEQFRLGRLEFQGNTTTKDKVLRREIFLEEGQIMDMETFKQSIYKLGQLGYFKVNDNPDFKVNQEKKTVDVTVKGTEEGKNDVQFGGGYSEGTGFFVQTQFSTRNFLGEGENLGLSFQRGNRQNFYSLSYADPWFMDTPNSFGVSLFNRNTDFPLSVGYQERSKRRIDRVRLSPAPLRQPLARLRPRAREDARRVERAAGRQRQRADLRHLRSDLHLLVDRAVVLVRLARQSVRHDARRPRQHRA